MKLYHLPPSAAQLVFQIETGAGTEWDDEPYDLLIDCSAPKSTWFLDPGDHGTSFLPQPVHNHLIAELAKEGPPSLGPDFAFPATKEMPAGLHVPMLGGHVSPGAGNLMALGVMSDRIIRSYLV